MQGPPGLDFDAAIERGLASRPSPVSASSSPKDEIAIGLAGLGLQDRERGWGERDVKRSRIFRALARE